MEARIEPDMRKTTRSEARLAPSLVLALLAACGASPDDPRGAIAVSPPSPRIAMRGQVSFSATLAGAPAAVTWAVHEGAAGGEITPAGLYTAPPAAGVFHVVATSTLSPDASGAATVTVSAPPPADLAAQLAALADKAIYFGHRSVGGNVMDGVRTLLAANPGAEPRVVTTSSAGAMGTGVWAEALNGDNFDPLGKIAAFAATMDQGAGAKLDLAFFKFCWVDFNDEAAYFAGGGTVEGLFTAYQSRIAALKAAYPSVVFVHFTAPLVTDAYGDGPTNPRREAYNALVRAAYGGGAEPLLDLALLESTDPAGSRVIGRYGPALHPGYTDDGGHLNAAGQEKVARALVALLAGL